MSFYGDDGDGGDDDIDITQLSGWVSQKDRHHRHHRHSERLRGASMGEVLPQGNPPKSLRGQPRTPVRLRAHEKQNCWNQHPGDRH